jgi:hypothetical protein
LATVELLLEECSIKHQQQCGAFMVIMGDLVQSVT